MTDRVTRVLADPETKLVVLAVLRQTFIERLGEGFAQADLLAKTAFRGLTHPTVTKALSVPPGETPK